MNPTDPAAGWWSDPDGTMHIDVDVMLRANGYEPNDQTRAQLVKVWRQFEADHGIPVEVVE